MIHPEQRDHPEPEETHPHAPMAGQARTTPEDEISLFDLFDAILRQRWLIISVTALVTVLAAAYAMTRPGVYRYQSSIRLGVMVMESGSAYDRVQREPIATPETAQAQLQASIIPTALRRVLGTDQVQPAGGGGPIPDIQVTWPKGAGIVNIHMYGPKSAESRYLEILEAVTSGLVRDHAEILESERIRLTRHLDRLDRAEERIAGHLDEIRSGIDSLTTATGARASANAQPLEGLQRRAGVLEDRLLDVAAERDRVSDYIAATRENAKFFTAEIDSETLAKQREAANRIAAMSGGVRPTAVIGPPTRSLTQHATSDAVILALGLAFGAALGLVCGFTMEFLAAARRRWRSKSGTGQTERPE